MIGRAGPNVADQCRVAHRLWGRRTLLSVAFGWLLAGVCGHAAAGLGQDGPLSLRAQLDRNRIFEGESVGLIVQLDNVKEPQEPDLSSLLEFFVIEKRGDQTLNSSRTLFRNGRMTQTREFGHQYRYLLTPKRSGLISLPALEVEVEGQRLKSRPLSLNVQAPEDQDLVVIKVETSPAQVYPVQKFAVTLRVFIRKLPGRYGTEDPLSPLWRNPPAINLPWVEDIPGLEAETTLSDWLSPKVGRRREPGFTINDIKPSGGLFFFDDSRASFRLDGKSAVPEDLIGTKIQGRANDYWAYTLSREWVPRRTGTYSFGPVSVKGRFVVDIRRDEFVPRDIYAVSKPVEVEVRDVPLEGRPSAYTGAVGNLRIRAEANPTELRVGDPITMTITVSGQGNLEEIAPIKLEDIPAFAESFRVYDATSETKGSRCVFTYSLRPISESVEAIPPYPFAYFDVGKEQFVESPTDSIPIQVEAASKLDESEIVQGAKDEGGDSALEVSAQGLLGNVIDSRDLAVPSLQPQHHLGVWALCLGIVGCLKVLVTRRDRRRGDTASLRRKKSLARAKQRIDQAKSALGAGNVEEGAPELRTALTGFVADFLNLPEAGMTRREVETALANHGVTSDLINAVGEIIDECDAAQYGAGAGTLVTRADMAKGALEGLAKALKAMPKYGGGLDDE